MPHTHTHSLHIALMYGYIVIRHEHITNLYTVTLSITICRSLINAKCYHSSYTLCSNNNISCVCARACVSRTRIDPRHLATHPFTIRKKKEGKSSKRRYLCRKIIVIPIIVHPTKTICNGNYFDSNEYKLCYDFRVLFPTFRL